MGAPHPGNIEFECAYGYKRVPPGRCVLPDSDFPAEECSVTDGGRPVGQTPRPIDVLSGTKSFNVTDYATADGGLSLRRHFSSTPYRGLQVGLINAPIGLANWAFDFQYELQLQIAFDKTWDSSHTLAILAPCGPAYSFQRQSDGSMKPLINSNYPLPQNRITLSFVGTWPTDLSTLSNASTTWTMIDSNDNVWTLQTFLDSSGKYGTARPVKCVTRQGKTLTFAYGSLNQLLSITDGFGKQITFEWLIDDPSTLGDPDTPATARAISKAHLPGGLTLNYYYKTISSPPPPLPEPDSLYQVQLTDGTTSDTTTYNDDNADWPYAVTSVTDTNALTRWSVTYDTKGRATQSTGPGGVGSYTVAYDPTASTFTRTVTNALGKQQIYHYSISDYSPSSPNFDVFLDSIEGVASANTPASTVSYFYDPSPNYFLHQQVSAENRITQYTHNSIGEENSRVDGYGTTDARTVSTTWNATYHVPDEIDEPNLTTNYYYTAGQLTQLKQTDTTTQSVPYSTNGQTRIWNFGYYPNGLLHTVDGPLAGTGDTTSFVYDANGYVKSITDALSHVTQITAVTASGLPATSIDPNGVTTSYTYDIHDRIKSITVNPGASQAATSFEYNAVGDIAKVIKPDGSWFQYEYNNGRQLLTVADNLSGQIKYTPDALGDRTATVISQIGITPTTLKSQTATFDELGRVMKEIGANSQTTQHFYDKDNNETSTIDPRNKLYGHAFDALNRLHKETDPDSFTTITNYNGKDDVTSVADARSLTTSYVRDGFGDAIQVTSPDTGTAVYYYDAGSNVTRRVDSRSVDTRYTYDVKERIKTRHIQGTTAEDVSFTYDSTGGGSYGVDRLRKIADPSGSTTFFYDALGNVNSEVRAIQSQTYTTGFSNNPAGHPSQITYPSGRLVNYTFDSMGRVSGITTKQNAAGTSVTVASNVTYMPFGTISGLTFGNGLALSVGYDQDYQVHTMVTSAGATTLQNLTYGYDPSGNVNPLTDNLVSARSQSLGYDDLNRLQTASGLYGSQSYSYDGTGNRISRVAGGVTEGYAIDPASNRVSTITAGSNVRSFSYLPTGQASNDNRDPGHAYVYNYNSTGRLSSATLNGGTVASYLMNGLEQRVVKTAGASTTHYIYDRLGHLLAEANGATGAIQKEYLWLDDLPVVMVDETTASPVLYYIHTDALGAPQKLTNASKAVVWDGAFDPLGNPASLTGSVTMNLRFPGQYFDAETGLSQNWNRDYDPSVGRYIQSDPIGLDGGINTYSYVINNPQRYRDNDGTGVAGGIFGGVVGGLLGAETGPGDAAFIAEDADIASELEDAIEGVQQAAKKDCYDDECDKQQSREEQDCWDNYGSVFGKSHWTYRGYLERSEIRGDMCRRGIPNRPPPWSDRDVDGFPTIHEVH